MGNKIVDLRGASDKESSELENESEEDLSMEQEPKKKRPKMSKKKKMIITFSIIVVAVAAFLIWLFVFGGYGVLFGNDVPDAEDNKDLGPTVRSPINGVEISTDIAQTRAFAIMVENHTDSRPHSGLVEADLVYEALAEGGITRFMAMYQSDIPDEIGPVRSARKYYLDWAMEYEPIYTHAGGSPWALEAILQYGLRDLNGIAAGSRFFWRDDGRIAPHNLYTSKELLELAKRDEVDDWGEDFVPVGTIGEYEYENGEKGSESQEIQLNFSSLDYQVNWIYDPDSNLYLREMAGESHKDRNTDEQIKASTVVVMKMDTRSSGEGQGRLEMDTMPSGEGQLFKNGEVYDIRWEKDSLEKRTRFYEKDSLNEMTLVPGQIWIEVIPTDKTVDVK